MTDEPVIRVTDIKVLMQLDRFVQAGYSLHVLPNFFGAGKAALAMMFNDEAVVMMPYHNRHAKNIVEAIDEANAPDDTDAVQRLCNALALDLTADTSKRN